MARGAKRFPGQGSEVSNLPARNPNFSGRGDLLEELHASLEAGSAAAVVSTGALHGLGGVGKTELALEFAHRFASDYDIGWWIPAELPTSATAALVTLAGRLGAAHVPDQSEMVTELLKLERQRKEARERMELAWKDVVKANDALRDATLEARMRAVEASRGG
jgi:hypothetical protein